MVVAVIGNLCLDFIVKAERMPKGEDDLPADITMHFGGNAANSALILSRLGTKTTFYSKSGKDVFSDFLAKNLEASGVVSRLKESDEKTPLTLCFSQGHERCFLYDTGATAGFSIGDLDEKEILNNKAVFVNGYSYVKSLDVTELFRKARERGITTIMDPCPGRDISKELEHIDILIVNQEELREIPNADKARIIIIKEGSKGASYRIDGKQTHLDCPKAEVVDTTGAGDAFDAGFIHCFMKTNDVHKATDFGNIVGTLAVTKDGAASLKEELEELEC